MYRGRGKRWTGRRVTEGRTKLPAPSAAECIGPPPANGLGGVATTSEKCWKTHKCQLSCSARDNLQQPGCQLEQCGHREADDVEVIALDPGHQGRTASLDRVAPGALAPFAAVEIPVEQRCVERPEVHHRGGGGCSWSTVLDHAHPADHRVSPTTEHRERL